ASQPMTSPIRASHQRSLAQAASAPPSAAIRKNAAATTFTRGPGRLALTSDSADSPFMAMNLSSRGQPGRRSLFESAAGGGVVTLHADGRDLPYQPTSDRRGTQARPQATT